MIINENITVTSVRELPAYFKRKRLKQASIVAIVLGQPYCRADGLLFEEEIPKLSTVKESDLF